jgi:hypothetical protein
MYEDAYMSHNPSQWSPDWAAEMRSKLTDTELLSAARALEELGPDVCWTITRLTNDDETVLPQGRGYGVSARNKERSVFAKARTVSAAAHQAVAKFLAWRPK